MVDCWVWLLLLSSLVSRTGIFASLIGVDNAEVVCAEVLEEEKEEVTVIRVCELVSCCC